MAPERTKKKRMTKGEEPVPSGSAAVATPTSPPTEGELGENGVEDESKRVEGLMNKVMQNEVILKNMFGLCPAKLLRKFRLVSKLWHRESLSAWRSSALVTFHFYQNHSYSDGIRSLERFVSFVGDRNNDCDFRSNKPYRRFKLYGLDFSKNKILIRKFWRLTASSITTLELSRCTFEGVEGFRKIVFNTCPNLRKLVMNFYVLTKYDYVWQQASEYLEPAHGEHLHLKSLTLIMDNKPLPVSWMEILVHFPGLKALQFNSVRSAVFENDALEEMLKAMQLIRQHVNRKLALEHLEWRWDLEHSRDYFTYRRRKLSSTVAALLTELQLPLKYFGLDFGNLTESTVVKNILEANARTLKKLTIAKAPAGMGTEFPFGVCFPTLHELELPNNLCHSMKFMEFTPNLRKLRISAKYDDVLPNTWPAAEAALANVRLQHMVDLRIDHAVTSKDIRCLAKWMPNVRRLWMRLNDIKFQTVCKKWRGLQHLEVGGIELTDLGVTGRLIDSDDEDGATVGAYPNITYLNCLRSFKIECPTGTLRLLGVMDKQRCQITDASAFHGFLKMESLQSLRLPAQMTVAARKALMEKIPDCQILIQE